MTWIVNDASLQEQSKVEEIVGFLKKVVAMRERNEFFKRNSQISGSIGRRKICTSTRFSEHLKSNNPNLSRYIMRWAAISGLDAKSEKGAEYEQNEEIIYENVDVRGTAIEHAIKSNSNGKLLSFQGGELNFENPLLHVECNLNGLPPVTHKLKNITSIEELESDIKIMEKVISEYSWNGLYQSVQTDFPNLDLSIESFAQLETLPFSQNVNDKVYRAFKELNDLIISSDEILDKIPVLSNECFNVEPESEISEELLTFEGNNGEKFYAPWHIDVNEANFRIHFEWPLERNRKKMQIFYVGPKFMGNGKSVFEKNKQAPIEVRRKYSWKDLLGLTNCVESELYESADQVYDTPYASDIRKIFYDFIVEGVYCIQGKPEVVIFKQHEENDDEVQVISSALWNQGIASVLVALGSENIRIYSLLKELPSNDNRQYLSSILMKEININESFEDFNFSLLSGRFWYDNPEFFDFQVHIGRVLLRNLEISHGKIMEEEYLNSDESKALLIQTLFIVILIDRKILTESFISNATNNQFENFFELLKHKDTENFEKLFNCISQLFNEDLFQIPCSLEGLKSACKLKPSTLEILMKFIYAPFKERLLQKENKVFNFEYVPVTLICETCSNFLSLNPTNRSRFESSFAFLPIVDCTLNSIWKNLNKHDFFENKFLDPTCGPGLFLIRCFQKICSHRDFVSESNSVTWQKLREVAERIYGFDSDKNSLKIALFSLYVLMLEYAPASTIRRILDKLENLPVFWENTIVPESYFKVDQSGSKFNVILGKPPRCMELTEENSINEWCRSNNYKLPNGHPTWAYVWKALNDQSDNRIVGFILPAYEFLHENSEAMKSARKSLFHNHILEVTDFSDFRNLIIEEHGSANSLIVFSKFKSESTNSKFQYIEPKVDIKFLKNNTISTRKIDRKLLKNSEIIENPSVLTERYSMRRQEKNLFKHMDSMPKLSTFIEFCNSADDIESNVHRQWLIVDGATCQNSNDGSLENSKLFEDSKIRNIPHISASSISPFVLKSLTDDERVSSYDNETGFVKTFHEPMILIAKPLSIDNCRLNAVMMQDPVAIQDDICAISFPECEMNRAKFLTALLNSRLLLWWIFHSTNSIKANLFLLNVDDFLNIPFPNADWFCMDNLVENAEAIQKKIVESLGKIEEYWSNRREKSVAEYVYMQKSFSETFNEVDELIYKYFDLSEDEILRIEDTLNYKLPALCPGLNEIPKFWQKPNISERKAYVNKLRECLSKWVTKDNTILIEPVGCNEDFSVIRLYFNSSGIRSNLVELQSSEFTKKLKKLSLNDDGGISNLQLSFGLRKFEDGSLFLVKPMQFRYWMESVAIEDTMNIALDFQKFKLGKLEDL